MTRRAPPIAAPAPRATLRLQLHKDFTFADARALVPYCARLGVSHLYVSPILSARAGSMHGYDVIDYGSVNAELGGETALRALVAQLRAHGMGLIVDIVPNHMAVGGADNRLWLDLLEWGPGSRYANFFDIDWDVADPALHNRVLAPFLGQPYGAALAAGEIRLAFDAGNGRFHFDYFEHRFPLAAQSYAGLLRADAALAVPAAQFAAVFGSRGGGRGARFDSACANFAQQAQAPATARAIDALLDSFAAATAAGRARLHRLLERQHYRLSWWRAAADEINWRRFFDVIELAGVRIEEPAAFEIVHATTLRLYAEGLIDGVRIDHIDGLADPRSYCHRLRNRLGRLASQRPPAAPRGPAYIVAEKILARGERLPDDWRIDGTTGYTFMSEVSALLHDGRGIAALTELWTGYSGRGGDFAAEQRGARRRVLQELLAADLDACAAALHRIARSAAPTRDWTLAAVRRVLTELLVQFPVYRTYADARGRSAADAELMAATVAAARPACRPAETELLDLIDRWLGGEEPRRLPTQGARRARLRAIARFQQLSSPVAAKATEDTAFYRHGRLLSRNEVGSNPAQFALAAADFHNICAQRTRRFPRALLATATHDHKRGEDARARLALLSEIAPRWRSAVQAWTALNTAHKRSVDGVAWPDAADEYMLYQTLVAVWPLTLRADAAAGLAQLAERVGGWQLKALREAKRFSSWAAPDTDYENACREFLDRLLDPHRSADFLAALYAFVDSIAAAGAVNGLAQTLIKLAAPGVPDIYQGCELWDFSLVDPDNRRPVDFALRARALAAAVDTAELMAQWRDGRIKQRLIQRALALRAQHPQVFLNGDYRPLAASGALAGHVFGFARRRDGVAVLALTLHFPATLVQAQPLLTENQWRDTHIVLPAALRGRVWRNVIDGAERRGPRLAAAELFAAAPVALLVAD